MKSVSFFLFVFVAFGLFFPSEAFACACCSEEGTYSIRTAKPDAYQLGILGEMKFDKAAELFLGVGDFSDLKGLSALQKDYESGSADAFGKLNLLNNFASKTWKFNFETPGGKSGSLTLPMPAQMLYFAVDIHDGSDKGLGPLLYKELRFKGNVSGGTGFFKSSIVKPTSYFLVFQGRGRGCDEVSNYSHWRLEIAGKNADYAFFGKLSSGNPIEEETERQ
ncbi:MAG: hypothetical protein WA584_04690 [Pyrinomonadaceae bacterium]